MRLRASPQGLIGGSAESWIRQGVKLGNLPHKGETGNRLMGVTALDEVAYYESMYQSNYRPGTRCVIIERW